MKLRLLFLFTLLSGFTKAQTTNDFVVSGYVYDFNDTTGIADYRVMLFERDSAGNGNDLIVEMVTDVDGYYSYIIPNGSLTGVNRNYKVILVGCGGNETEAKAMNTNGTTNNFTHDFYICYYETCQSPYLYLTTKNLNGTYDVYIYSSNAVADDANYSYTIAGYGVRAGDEPAIFTNVVAGTYNFTINMWGTDCPFTEAQGQILIPKIDYQECGTGFTLIPHPETNSITAIADVFYNTNNSWSAYELGTGAYIEPLGYGDSASFRNIPYGVYDIVVYHSVSGGQSSCYPATLIDTIHFENTDGSPCDATYLASMGWGTPNYVFYGTNAPGIHHVWLFGTDTISTNEACYIYGSDNFSFTHIVYDDNGCYASITDTMGGYYDNMPCQPGFSIYPIDSSNPYEFRIATNTTNLLSHTWTIDGVVTGHNFIFNHSFPDSLPHQVCLTIENPGNCIDSACVIVTANDNLLSGQVGFQDTVCADCVNDATAYLYQIMNGDTAMVGVFIDSTAIVGSLFQFEHLPNGRYIVRAALNPTNPQYNDYLPTYTDEIADWHTSAIYASQYLTGVHYPYPTGPIIRLLAVELNPGSGLIGGTVIFTDTLRSSTAESATVYIKNPAGQIAKYDITDEMGMFELPNLAFGTYTLYADYPGYTCVPQIITIDSLNPIALDNQIVMNLTPVPAATAVIENKAALTVDNPFPNPTSDNIFIPINAKKTQSLTFTVYNLLGQPVLSQSNTVSAGSQTIQLPTESLAQGIYLLQITDKRTGVMITKKIVKD